MNSSFTNRQIEVYANKFRKGDAIWCRNEWLKVGEVGGDVMPYLEINKCAINYISKGEHVPIYIGFRENSKANVNPYRVTTLEHYDIQEGDKVVWLSDSFKHFTFGSSYVVLADSDGNLVAYDNDNCARSLKSENWGIIPKWENIKTKVVKEPKEKLKHIQNETTSSKSILDLGDNNFTILNENHKLNLENLNNGEISIKSVVYTHNGSDIINKDLKELTFVLKENN